MSYGKMNSFISILSSEPIQDREGFVTSGDTTLATVRAYKEEKHGNEAWKNRAAFSTATVLFRFRKIPNFTVTTSMFILCGSERYNILSSEDVRSHGMYMEVMSEKVSASEG